MGFMKEGKSYYHLKMKQEAIVLDLESFTDFLWDLGISFLHLLCLSFSPHKMGITQVWQSSSIPWAAMTHWAVLVAPMLMAVVVVFVSPLPKDGIHSYWPSHLSSQLCYLEMTWICLACLVL